MFIYKIELIMLNFSNFILFYSLLILFIEFQFHLIDLLGSRLRNNLFILFLIFIINKDVYNYIDNNSSVI